MPSDVTRDQIIVRGPSLVAGAGSALAIGFEQVCADLAVLSTGIAVIGLFAVSPVVLEHFQIAYISPGGSALSKFHPSTFFALAALVLRCLATGEPIRSSANIIGRDVNIGLLAVAVSIAGAVSVLVTKTPVTPLIDTFVLPVILLFLLRDLNPAVLRWLAILVAIVFCINAVMALYEFLNGLHIVTVPVSANVSSDPTRGDVVFDWRADLMHDWRATALLGHPLVNGLIVGAFILCLLAPGSRWLSPSIKVPLGLLQSVSMFAFGARASLILILVFAAYMVADQARKLLQQSRRPAPRAVAAGLLFAVLIVGVGIATYQAGLFDRTIERFGSDAGSAETRATMLQLFQHLSWSDLVLGPSQEATATWQRLYGLEFGIESTWVGLVLSYGLVVTACLVIGLIAFSRSVIGASGRGAAALLLFFFISVSGTTGLSGKTTSLAMIVVLAILYLHKDERRVPLRSAPSVQYGVSR